MENLLRVLVVQREAVEKKLKRARGALVHSDEKPNSNIRNRCFLQVYLDNVKRFGEEYQHLQDQIYALPLSGNQRAKHTEAHYEFGSLYNDTANTLSTLIECATRAAVEEPTHGAVTSSVGVPLEPESVAQTTSKASPEECITSTKPGAPESLDEDCRSIGEIDEQPATESVKENAVARNHPRVQVIKKTKNKKIKTKKCKTSHKLEQCDKLENQSESEKSLVTFGAGFDSPTVDRDRFGSFADWQDESCDTLTTPTVADTTSAHEPGGNHVTGTPAGAAAFTEKPSLNLPAVGRADGLCDTLPSGRVLHTENLLERRMVHAIDADVTVGDTNDSNDEDCLLIPTERSDCDGYAAAKDKPVTSRITGERPKERFESLTGHIPHEMMANLFVDIRGRVDLPFGADYIWIDQNGKNGRGESHPALWSAKLGRISERVIASDYLAVARSLWQTIGVKSFIERLDGFSKNDTYDEFHPIQTADKEERQLHGSCTYERFKKENVHWHNKFEGLSLFRIRLDEDWIRLTESNLKFVGSGCISWKQENWNSMLLADWDDQDAGTRTTIDLEKESPLTFCSAVTVRTRLKLRMFGEVRIDFDDPGPLYRGSWTSSRRNETTVLTEVRIPGRTTWDGLLKNENERDKAVTVPEAGLLAAVLFAGVLRHFRDTSEPVFSDNGAFRRVNFAQNDEADSKHRFYRMKAFLSGEYGVWRVARRQHEPTAGKQGLLFDDTAYAYGQALKQDRSQTGRRQAGKIKENPLCGQIVPRTGWPTAETVTANRRGDGVVTSTINGESIQRAVAENSKLRLDQVD